MIINRIYENQNLLSLQLVFFLVGLRTYQHPDICRPTQILVVMRPKAWVCGRWLAGIAGSNPAGGMNVFCESCVL